jgi:succinate dehydrogenase flavin-adding protein (antitoxin of CptAB toxin-antitoxin module)
MRRWMSEMKRLKFADEYPENIEDLRNMIRYRCGRTGTKETEFILREWADLHIGVMGREELIQFQREVLNQETLDLYQIMLGHMPTGGLKYLEMVAGFVRNKLNGR